MQFQDAEPVLIATYKLFEQDDFFNGEQVNEAMGLNPNDESTGRAFKYLDNSGYLKAGFQVGSLVPVTIEPTEKGLQHCSNWPSHDPSVFVENLLKTMDEQIHDAQVPEAEKSRLKQLRNSVIEVGQNVLVEAISRTVEHKTGL